MKFRLLAASVAAALAAAPAGAVVIDFDSLADSAVVTNQFATATFSSVSGSVVRTSAQSLGSSTPNIICTGPSSGGIDCTQNVFVTFTSPVDNLSFVAVGDNMVGQNGTVDVFDGNGLVGSVAIIGDNVFLTPYTVNLGAFSGVTSITIRSVNDPGGLGYDDFSFNVGASTAAPEPASMALLGAGLLGLAGLRRRTR